MKHFMETSGHLQHQCSDAVCGFLSFMKSLLWTNRSVAAILNVLFVGFSAFMFVDMTPVKHSRGKFSVVLAEAFQNVNIENLLQLLSHQAEIVESSILEL